MEPVLATLGVAADAAQPAPGKTRSGTAPLAAALAPGVVRHGMLVDKGVRDTFAALAVKHDVNQGDLLAAVVEQIKKPEVAAAIAMWLANHKPKQLMKGPSKELRDAIKKVDPKALEAFLKAQAAL